MQHLILPDYLEDYIRRSLARLNVSVMDASYLAPMIQALSDYYTGADRRRTPWDRRETLVAYFAYFLPLHFCRNLQAIQRGQSLGFFKGVDTIVDVGAGLGTSRLAFHRLLPELGADYLAYDPYVESEWRWHQEAWSPRTRWADTAAALRNVRGPVLGVFSYSLNEFLSDFSTMQAGDYLRWDQLMFVEPALMKDARRLMALREPLLRAGYSIWAPCTHTDRVLWQLPDWLRALHAKLPMHNESLSFSYLLVSRRPPEQIVATPTLLADSPARTGPAAWRVVGDPLREKGKTRQMVCRSETREFLSWLDRDGPRDVAYARGDLLPALAETDFVRRGGGELRVLRRKQRGD